MNPSIRFVSFATDKFSESRQRLEDSYSRFGIANHKIYDPKDPVITRCVSENEEILSKKRGWGYWLWKYYIIEYELSNTDSNSILFYTDVGVELIADPAPLLKLSNKNPIVLFYSNHSSLQKFWTKRDCFVILDADCPDYWEMVQLTATFQIYRNSAKAREFVAMLKTAMRDPHILTDLPNISGKDNLPGFIDHRHDQSVLSIFAKRRNIQIFRDPSQHGNQHLMEHHRSDLDGGIPIEYLPPMANSDYGQIFNHHRTRDKSLYKHIKVTVRRSARQIASILGRRVNP
jgi:hypothetical protein